MVLLFDCQFLILYTMTLESPLVCACHTRGFVMNGKVCQVFHNYLRSLIFPFQELRGDVLGRIVHKKDEVLMPI
jgi:hypothetical protein